MSYQCRIFNSINEVDLDAWQKVLVSCGESIFMQPRFIAAVETSMKESCQFLYVIVYDDGGCPVACACLTVTTIDLADIAAASLAWAIRLIPARLRKLKLFVCGLPGTPGEKTLAVASNAASKIIPELNRVVHELATEAKAHAIVYKELGKQDLESLSPLLDLGLQCIPIPQMNFVDATFHNFEQYMGAMKSRYRRPIARSMRKLNHPGIQQKVFTDPDEIRKLYTPEVHALYLQMVAKAPNKFEILSIEYFRQLTLRLQGEIELVAILKDSKFIAFGWCVHAGSSYYLLFAGLDYRYNQEFDLYFNMLYLGFDTAMRKRVSKIHVGQAANEVKAHLGCYSEPLYVLVQGLGPVMSRIVQYGARFLIVKLPTVSPSKVFRTAGAEEDVSH